MAWLNVKEVSAEKHSTSASVGQSLNVLFQNFPNGSMKSIWHISGSENKGLKKGMIIKFILSQMWA